LIAGPHDPALIDTAPDGDLTLLVRGVPDAEALAARYADRPGVTVCCGGLEKLDTEPAYDTIIALDGLGRLSSAEDTQLSWDAALELLTGALRPGGLLLLSVQNFFGLHRLLALPPEATDTDWVVDSEYATRPAGLARVRAHLTGAGLDVCRTYAAYPAPTAPAALLGEDVLADDEVTGYLQATLARVSAGAQNVLSDPGRLAAGALRHDIAAQLAPAWILLARRSPDAGTTRDQDTAAELDLPSALIATGPDQVTGVDGAPRGRTLEDLLIAAGLQRDLPAVRELLVTWQDGAAAGVPAGQVIVEPGGSMVALVPGGEPAAALRQFAATLIRSGFAHPWPALADADDLTVALAAMAGRELDPAKISAGRPDPGDARSVRELVVERDRLATQLAEARAKAVWYEQMLTMREEKLAKAQALIELFSASGPARAGKAFVGGVRIARRTARSAVRLIRPNS
jgi:hypothetical protein